MRLCYDFRAARPPHLLFDDASAMMARTCRLGSKPGLDVHAGWPCASATLSESRLRASLAGARNLPSAVGSRASLDAELSAIYSPAPPQRQRPLVINSRKPIPSRPSTYSHRDAHDF